MPPWFRVLYGAVSALTLTSSANAQDVPAAVLPSEEGWRIDIGVAALSFPQFPGSEDTSGLLIPTIQVGYEDLFFASLRDGVGYNLIRSSSFVAGPVVNFAFPRREQDSPSALRGLGDVAFTVEAGAFVRYDFEQIASAKIEARQGINGHEGLVAQVSIDLNAPPLAGKRLFLSAGPRLSLFDEQYARAYYGVSSEQAANSGYAEFLPDRGYEFGIGAAAVYLINDRVSATAFANYSRLDGDLAASPIIRSEYGSRDQVASGVAITYRFNFGD